FVNRNHFAGWMLMGLPLTFGLLCAMLSRAMRGVRPYWRDRLMWLSTPDASLILLTGAAPIVMAISLVLTLSLSVMTALAAAIARFPLTGTGLNTYGVATILYQRHDLEHHYEQAHNDYLQLMAEGGVLLAVPAALCLGVFAHTVRRRFRDETSTTAYWLRVGA